MNTGFNYKEYSKWVKNLGIAKKDFHNWLKTFLLQQAQEVVAKGKPRTPVDTHNLVNRWYIGRQKIVQKDVVINGQTQYSPRSGRPMREIDWSKSDIASIKVINNLLEVEIGLGADYASYIEYGHHSYAGRYMLTISINEVQNALPSKFSTEWRKFLHSKGVI